MSDYAVGVIIGYILMMATVWITSFCATHPSEGRTTRRVTGPVFAIGLALCGAYLLCAWLA